uniref:MLO-like protein n=1 Tax=Oryza rufipogon TaxID=4529 RepID=A0A0E0R4Z6_ORYRU
MVEEGRSLAETPTWSVATVTTLMVAACFLVERGISRFAKWLRKTKRKAMLAALEKIREELMLLGVISLLLSQTARWISEICVPSSLFTSRFYICSETDYEDLVVGGKRSTMEMNQTVVPNGLFGIQSQNVCSEGHEPFVSYEGLEQLHRFLFILGITHVLYTFVTVVLSMIKIYSWRKFETQACQLPAEQLQARRTKVMQRQSTFVFHHTSHPWSKNKILIWMYHKLPHSYNFHKYMVRSMEDDYNGSVGISWPLWAYAIICIFVNIHGLNIYFWISFAPAILVLLVGTELQHVIAQLALEVVGATAPYVGTQLKLRDDLFWFGKPRVLWWLIQFISFQNAFEMATFVWSLLELSVQSCFMKNHYMIVLRLTSGILVQFWCSYNTLPLNVIITQMGSKFKKSLVSESVRESLHSWCKRVKDKNRHNLASRSVCSLDTTYEETDHETATVGTLSRTVSATSLDEELTVATVEDNDDDEEMSRIEQEIDRSL